jgi:hypothetical protein
MVTAGRAGVIVAGLALALASAAATVAVPASPAAAASSCSAQRVDWFLVQGSCANADPAIRYRVRAGCNGAPSACPVTTRSTTSL